MHSATMLARGMPIRIGIPLSVALDSMHPDQNAAVENDAKPEANLVRDLCGFMSVDLLSDECARPATDQFGKVKRAFSNSVTARSSGPLVMSVQKIRSGTGQ